MMIQQAGSNACTQDKRREFAENPTSRSKPWFKISASYNEVTHENSVSIFYRPVDDSVFIRIRHCFWLRCYPGDPARLCPQTPASESLCKTGRGGRFRTWQLTRVDRQSCTTHHGSQQDALFSIFFSIQTVGCSRPFSCETGSAHTF
jgi:hypothetical protein